MREARRQADKMVAMEPETPLCDKATELFHNFSTRLSDSYQELEQAISDKVEVSRKAMAQWQKETRELVKHISLMRRQAKTSA